MFNAPAFQAENADPDLFSLELAGLAATAIPLQLTCGGDTWPAFREITEILAKRLRRPPAKASTEPGTVPRSPTDQLAPSIEDFHR